MLRVLFVLQLCCGICWAAPPAVDPESVEPPLGYSLLIGDQSVRLREGEPTTINGKFENPEIKLTTDDFRTFRYAGVSFRYLKHFAFEADFELKGRRSWALDGNNCIISLFTYEAKITASAYTAALVKQYGAENCRVTDSTLTLAGQALKGTRVEARIATAKIVQEIFLLPIDGKSTLLMLQDTPRDDGSASDERKLAGKLLTESFAITPKRP